MRTGLAGTGYWAQTATAPGLAAADGIELTAVWGRNPRAAADLAASHGAKAYEDLGAFLDAVDAVAFSVPPDVQAPIALRAAWAGKHLLLEKPVATSAGVADELVAAVSVTGVASVVFFTSRFQAPVRAWLAEVNDRDGWAGGYGVWIGSGLRDGNPFNTPWRRDKGALWDVGPHAVSLLWAALGPVTGVHAQAGPADVSHLVLQHAGGPTSTLTLTLSAPEDAQDSGLTIWGEPGRSAAPLGAGGGTAATLATAATELADLAAAGRTDHPCDVRFGRDVTRVLAAAAAQLDPRSPR